MDDEQQPETLLPPAAKRRKCTTIKEGGENSTNTTTPKMIVAEKIIDDGDVSLVPKTSSLSYSRGQLSQPPQQQVATTTPMTANSDTSEASSSVLACSKKKRKKFALFFGYNGASYRGLQINETAPGDTIESVLFQAMRKVKGVFDPDIQSITKAWWSRCARTDKGVSAACNIVSMLMFPVDDFVSRVNSHLVGSNIHVFGILPVTKRFNAKKRCEGRVYEYVVPASILFARSGRDYDPSTPSISDPSLLKAINMLNNLLKQYVGTHKFHNFTQGKSSLSKDVKRYIFECYCADPLIVSGLVLLPIRIKGQSFMFFQIRKMIGLVLRLIYEGYDENSAINCMNSCLSNATHAIAPAPALGLLLDRCLFSAYDASHGKVKNATLDLQTTAFEPASSNFKVEALYPIISSEEQKEHDLVRWLEHLSKNFRLCIQNDSKSV